MDLKYETIIVDPERDRRPPVGAAVGLGPPGPDRPPGMWSSPGDRLRSRLAYGEVFSPT